jgi:hypothetical protein
MTVSVVDTATAMKSVILYFMISHGKILFRHSTSNSLYGFVEIFCEASPDLRRAGAAKQKKPYLSIEKIWLLPYSCLSIFLRQLSAFL